MTRMLPFVGTSRKVRGRAPFWEDLPVDGEQTCVQSGQITHNLFSRAETPEILHKVLPHRHIA